ncbi:hypothetical protein T440DRAFT_76511 [Plenodomus tracheiphilus IPT5]|uniref:Uncharacterized protein n=1 Tax=Plenodomus tracheiphilus IPT5 TaxID=1408161 RepID=A0A6A7B6T2_9PLEO|nr:hypothetical protein T440DRAFT_76511 [Plenodomus tracheiphilus IPT5]
MSTLNWVAICLLLQITRTGGCITGGFVGRFIPGNHRKRGLGQQRGMLRCISAGGVVVACALFLFPQWEVLSTLLCAIFSLRNSCLGSFNCMVRNTSSPVSTAADVFQTHMGIHWTLGGYLSLLGFGNPRNPIAMSCL